MIADEGARHACKLVGFGGVVCGYCDAPFKPGRWHVGDRHVCGASVWEIMDSAGKKSSVTVGEDE